MTTINRDIHSTASLTIEEKITRLSAQDKAYLNGYLDRALRGRDSAAVPVRPESKRQSAQDG